MPAGSIGISVGYPRRHLWGLQVPFECVGRHHPHHQVRLGPQNLRRYMAQCSPFALPRVHVACELH